MAKTENEWGIMQYTIRAVEPSTQAAMLHFLRRHADFSLFLLGNFENYGIKLSKAPYSGNFKLIYSGDEIVGVFCLTKKGSLIIQSEVYEPIFKSLLSTCQEESIPLTGLVGDWQLCHPLWNYLKAEKAIKEELFASKEVLYSLDLTKAASLPQPHVRLLTERDFAAWKPLRISFLNEQRIPNGLDEDQVLELFVEKVKKKIIWGCFIQNQLVSIADFNAKALNLAQVGGVYTSPPFRRHGYSKAVMHQLIADAKGPLQIDKLIIFTEENNLPARQLYESLGTSLVGYFALFFGK